MAEAASFTAGGEIATGSGAATCEFSVGPTGVTARDGDHAIVRWPGHEIGTVAREDYEIFVSNVFDGQTITLRRFGRRTDELETALRGARADALARLMAPPGASVLDVFEAVGDRPGLLYRCDDGLRWVPDAGDCTARLYSELGVAQFDSESYELVLTGPFGETRIAGLRRVTRELASETSRHIGEARESFAAALERAGLPWRKEAVTGEIAAHVAFDASADRIRAVADSEIICEGRREYWRLLVQAEAVERLVLSPLEDRLRLVALCAVSGGELYEALSETDHASYVFEDADAVVRAWTEVGFRREPIFSPSERDAAAALARVLPSLSEAREGLRDRVVHDEPNSWSRRLFK
ncbi:MAG: hypothetical protein ACLFU7_04760 [Armatimonadota bacterium]